MQAAKEPLETKPTQEAILSSDPPLSSHSPVAQPLSRPVIVPMPDIREIDEEEEVSGGCLCCKVKGREATDRLHFVRKVYMILFMQIAITTGWLVLVMTIDPIRDFVRAKWPVLIAAFGVAISALLVLFCVPRLHQRVPWNYLLLFIFVRKYVDFMLCLCVCSLFCVFPG